MKKYPVRRERKKGRERKTKKGEERPSLEKERKERNEQRETKRRDSSNKHPLVNLMTERMTIMRWDGTKIMT